MARICWPDHRLHDPQGIVDDLTSTFYVPHEGKDAKTKSRSNDENTPEENIRHTAPSAESIPNCDGSASSAEPSAGSAAESGGAATSTDPRGDVDDEHGDALGSDAAGLNLAADVPASEDHSPHAEQAARPAAAELRTTSQLQRSPNSRPTDEEPDEPVHALDLASEARPGVLAESGAAAVSAKRGTKRAKYTRPADIPASQRTRAAILKMELEDGTAFQCGGGAVDQQVREARRWLSVTGAPPSAAVQLTNDGTFVDRPHPGTTTSGRC